MNKKGFTLIELLVVIAIIGILSSVVLASLNTARSKGNDAAVKSNLSNLRAAAEIYYDGESPHTYEGACDDDLAAGFAAAEAAGGSGTGECNDSLTAWAAWSQLSSSTDYWCVDSTGVSENIGGTPTTGVTAC